MKRFLLSQPFGIFGALAIIGLLKGVLDFHNSIESIVAAWEAITHPIVNFLFGWIADLLGLKIPAWLKNYIVLSTVMATALIRARRAEREAVYARLHQNPWGDTIDWFEHQEDETKLSVMIKNWPKQFFIWPFSVIHRLCRRQFGQHEVRWHFGDAEIQRKLLEIQSESEVEYLIFAASSVLWTLVIICVNYALIFGNT